MIADCRFHLGQWAERRVAVQTDPFWYGAEPGNPFLQLRLALFELGG